jgi:hypothetical protein
MGGFIEWLSGKLVQFGFPSVRTERKSINGAQGAMLQATLHERVTSSVAKNVAVGSLADIPTISAMSAN